MDKWKWEGVKDVQIVSCKNSRGDVKYLTVNVVNNTAMTVKLLLSLKTIFTYIIGEQWKLSLWS